MNEMNFINNLLSEDAMVKELSGREKEDVQYTSMYKMIHALMNSPVIGFYLSPSMWAKKRTELFNKLIAKYQEEGYGEEEATEKARSEFDNVEQEQNVIPIQELVVNAQQLGEKNDYFLNTPDGYYKYKELIVRKLESGNGWHDPDAGKAVSLGTLTSINKIADRARIDSIRAEIKDKEEELAEATNDIERRRIDNEIMSLEREMADISSVVMTPTNKERIKELDARMENIKSELELDVVDIEQRQTKENELESIEDEIDIIRNKEQVWIEQDFEILIEKMSEKADEFGLGGDRNVMDGFEKLISEFTKSKIKTLHRGSVEIKDEETGKWVRDENRKEQIIDNLIKKEQERLKQEWEENKDNLKLSKISDDLYILIVVHILERLERKIGEYEKLISRYELSKPDIIPELRNHLNEMASIVESTKDEKNNINLIIGNKIFRRGKDKKWNTKPIEGRDKNVIDKLRGLMKNVRCANSKYNVESVLKRSIVLDMLIGSVDIAITEWVQDRILNNIYDFCDQSKKGMLNVGTPPKIVNDFIGDLDNIENSWGFGARVSWKLIDYIREHHKKADRYFAGAEGLSDSVKAAGLGELSYDSIKNYNPGITEEERKQVFRDKRTGKIITLKDKSIDTYIPLALMDLNQKNQFLDELTGINTGDIGVDFDSSKMDQNLQTIEDNNIKIDAKLKKIEELQSKINDETKTTFENELQEIQKQLKDAQVRGGDVNELMMRRDALKTKIKNHIPLGGVNKEGIEKQIAELSDEISELEKDNESLYSEYESIHDIIFNRALELKNNNIDTYEKLQQKTNVDWSPGDTDAFKEWLQIKGYEEDIEKYQKLTEKIKSLSVASRDNPEIIRSINKAIEDRNEISNRINNHKEEFMQSRAEADIESVSEEKKEIIEHFFNLFPTFSDAKIASMASDFAKENNKDMWISSEDVRNTINRDRNNNMMNAMMSVIKHKAGKEGDVRLQFKNLVYNDETPEGMAVDNFIRGMVQAMVAKIESAILFASQTRQFSGGGINKESAYVDEYGVTQSVIDPTELTGEKFNPYHKIQELHIDNRMRGFALRDLNNDIEESKTKIDILNYGLENGVESWKQRLETETDENTREILDNLIKSKIFNEASIRREMSVVTKNLKEKEERAREEENEIKSNKSIIKIVEKYMDDHPVVKEMSSRIKSLKTNNNPYLLENKEKFDLLHNKMHRFVTGEVDPEVGEIEFSSEEEKMIDFLNNHVPTMRTMGTFCANISNRYIESSGKSRSIAGVTGEPPTPTKDVGDRAALETLIKESRVYVGFDEHFDEIREFMIENDIADRIGLTPRNINEFVVVTMTLANHPKVRDGVDQIFDEFVKDYMFKHISDVGDKRAVTELLNKVKELIPREPLAMSSEEVTHLFDDMKSVAMTNDSKGMSYDNPMMRNIVDTIDMLGDSLENKDFDKFEEVLNNYFDAMDEFETYQNSVDVYVDIMNDLEKIDKLYNLKSVASISEYLGDPLHDDKNDLIKSLSNFDIQFDANLSNSEMISQADDHAVLAVDRCKTKINKFKNLAGDDGKNYGSIEEVEEVINNIVMKYNLKYEYATSGPEDQKALEYRINNYELNIENSKEALNRSFSHDSAVDSAEYEERTAIYDKLIEIRNRLAGRDLTPPQRVELIKSIVKRLRKAAYDHGKDSDEVSLELIKYDQLQSAYKSLIAGKKISVEAGEIAKSTVEVSVTVLFKDLNLKLDASIYPDRYYKERFEVLGDKETLLKDVLMFSPNKLFGRPGEFDRDRPKTMIAINYKGGDIPKEFYSKDLSGMSRLDIARIEKFKKEQAAIKAQKGLPTPDEYEVDPRSFKEMKLDCSIVLDEDELIKTEKIRNYIESGDYESLGFDNEEELKKFIDIINSKQIRVDMHILHVGK